DHNGRGWETLARDFSWVVASCAVTPWMPLKEEDAKDLYDSMLPEVMAKASGCENKFHEGILDKASEHPIDLPPWTGFEPIDSKTSKNTNLPEALDEVRVAEWLVDSSLELTLMSSASLGWLLWDGSCWRPTTEDYVRRRVVRAIKLANSRAVDAGLDRNVIKKLNNYLTDSKVKALPSL